MPYVERYYDPKGEITGKPLKYLEDKLLAFDRWLGPETVPIEWPDDGDFLLADMELMAYALALRANGRLRKHIVFDYTKSFAAPSTPESVIRRHHFTT